MFFAAIFALTLARLAQPQKMRRKLPFWRRIVAAGNASLVLRACGADSAQSLFKWVVDHSGKPFVFSTLLEEVSESRWKCDWLTDNHLVSDAFGRIDTAIKKVPENSRPAEWRTRVEKAREWIAKNNFELFSVLPAIGESARRKQPSIEETFAFRPRFQKFCDEPTLDGLINCAPALYAVGVPPETSVACHAVFAYLQKVSARWTDDGTQYGLQLLSYVSVLSQDESLADSVCQFAIEKTRELTDADSTLEIVCRLVECSSAYANREKAIETLGRRLEAVAFLAKPVASMDLYDSLRHLQVLDELLSQKLGRALAGARLARKAA